MKKTIITILIVTIIIGIFFPMSYAYEDTEKTTLKDTNIDYDTYKKDSEEGKSKVGESGEEKDYKIKEGTKNSVIKGVTKIFNTIPTTVRFFLYFVADAGTTEQVKQDYGDTFTIQKLVFNKMNFFDVNFFRTDNTDTQLQINIKTHVAKIYYLIRNIAMVANLVVLVYVGVRMAIASVAEEKARYKQMLIGWLQSFIIMLLLPYIMIIILGISETLIALCEQIMKALCGNEILNVEENLFNSATTSTEKGFAVLIPTILYWVLTFYQLKFFWIYGKRLFSIAFLVVISPFVLVQYSFDKAGDGQASSFKIWMKEYTVNLMIQPLHAILYTIFMTIASNIMLEAPLLAVIFLSSLTRGERVLRNILRLKNTATVQSMEDQVKAEMLMEKEYNA